MDLTIKQGDGYTLVQTHGPLDEGLRDTFREHLHPLVGRSGVNLLIDLSDSPRINSPGVGALVALVADANTHGNRVILLSPQSFVTVVFNVTRLNNYFEIAANPEEALERLKAGQASSANSG
ncbi:MAG TPA: STAS domain-containing protein [Pirellulaceae bacterium]|nr:STAS domain-containing protein [Pirellulaceae bacterium]